MGLLERMRFRNKILLVLAVPLLGLVWFSWQGVVEKYQLSREMKALALMSGLGVRSSNLVHEIQKERGLTAGFLGSKGAQFTSELAVQRNSSDERLTALREYRQGIKAERWSEEFASRLRKAMDFGDRLAAQRQAVDRLKIETKEAIDFYTEMNAALLDVVNEITKLASDPELMRLGLAYASFLQGKERTGIERAVLNNTFAAGRFGPGIFNYFSAVVASQETYFSLFQSFAPSAEVAFYRQKMNDPAVAEVKRMRDIAFSKGSSQEGSFDIQARHWFETITRKIDLLKDVEGRISEDITATAAGLERGASLSFWIYLIITGLALAAALLVSSVLIRSMTGQLGGESWEVMAVATAVSRGDLSMEMDDSRPAKSIYGVIREMVANLAVTVSQVKETAETVSSAAGEISQGNQDLSERTQQQASAIEETASALEQMTSSVKQNAANSAQANDLAKKTANMAKEGGAVVDRTMQAMQAATQSSKKIADIINVVNEIAFQTNLLALNAAVEAARAGEVGRGFAVVAGEVRNLAGRSAIAAKEIQALINESVAAVQQGNTLVAESGRLLGEIIVNVQNVTDTVGEITAASQEQATGIDEINKAVSLMDEAVQQNAALVEEAASAAESMADAAQDLHAQMDQFKVGSASGQAGTLRALPGPGKTR